MEDFRYAESLCKTHTYTHLLSLADAIAMAHGAERHAWMTLAADRERHVSVNKNIKQVAGHLALLLESQEDSIDFVCLTRNSLLFQCSYKKAYLRLLAHCPSHQSIDHTHAMSEKSTSTRMGCFHNHTAHDLTNTNGVVLTHVPMRAHSHNVCADDQHA